jgi:hypothetical protein
MAAVFTAACGPWMPETPEFTQHVQRPAEPPIFEETVDEVTAEVYVDGECVILVVAVPEFGEFSKESCGQPDSARIGVSGFDCAEAADNRCVRSIPGFIVEPTLPEASAVCVDTGDPARPGLVIEALHGWFLIVGRHGDVYPLDENGERLDSLSNEIDDRVSEACGL